VSSAKICIILQQRCTAASAAPISNLLSRAQEHSNYRATALCSSAALQFKNQALQHLHDSTQALQHLHDSTAALHGILSSTDNKFIIASTKPQYLSHNNIKQQRSA
jgi:hypothetical protein